MWEDTSIGPVDHDWPRPAGSEIRWYAADFTNTSPGPPLIAAPPSWRVTNETLPGSISRICFSMQCCDFAATTSSSISERSAGVKSLPSASASFHIASIFEASAFAVLGMVGPAPISGDCSVPTTEVRRTACLIGSYPEGVPSGPRCHLPADRSP
jgi:hypothetical protein